VDLADDLPADFPLEPGSGVPRTLQMQSAALRVAQSEAALGGIAPKADAGPSRTSDYIAAARRAAQAAAAESPAETANSRKETASKGQVTLFTRGGRAVLIAITAFLLIFTALRYFDGFLPALLRTEAVNSAIEAPKPAEPEAKTPASQNRSSLPDPGGPVMAGAPAAGVIGPNREADLLGEKATDPDITGSIDTAKRTSGPLQTAAVPTKPELLAAQGAELPATIGTPALRAAAIAGEPAAAYEIGARYIEGRGVQANAAEAVKWLEHALAKGSAPAAYRLGSLYEKALGVGKNLAEAKRYYMIAAEGGHIKAMHNLAVLHAEGIDGKPDYRTAARWFRMAADRGVRDSQYNLGILYARGLGVEQNLAESFRWFSFAAGQGDPDAAKKRDDVAKRLDMQTLVAAKLAVQTWSATPADDAANAVRLKPEWGKTEASPPRKRSVKNSTPPPNSSIDKDAWRQLMQ
jgi:localization factor PodJL